MADILDRHDSRQFGVYGRFGRFAETLTRRSEPVEPAVAINQADIEVAKAHDVVAGLELGNTDDFPDQDLTDEDAVASPHDLARAAHAAMARSLRLAVVGPVLHVVAPRCSAGGRRRSGLAVRPRSPPVDATSVLSACDACV